MREGAMWKIAVVVGLVMSGQSTMMMSEASYDTEGACHLGEPAVQADIEATADRLYGAGNYIVATKCFLPGINH